MNTHSIDVKPRVNIQPNKNKKFIQLAGHAKCKLSQKPCFLLDENDEQIILKLVQDWPKDEIGFYQRIHKVFGDQNTSDNTGYP